MLAKSCGGNFGKNDPDVTISLTFLRALITLMRTVGKMAENLSARLPSHFARLPLSFQDYS